MNSAMWIVVVIPSIMALIFSVFVTIGVITDIADRAKQLQLKEKAGNVAILTPSIPLSTSPNPKTSSPLNPQITLK